MKILLVVKQKKNVVAGAKSLGIPVGMLLYSWDNLSTKGCLHQPPDRMFVWNELQRREALSLHGFPEDRVVIAGAPRFDAFFELRPETRREEFYRRHETVGSFARSRRAFSARTAWIALCRRCLPRRSNGPSRIGRVPRLRVVRPRRTRRVSNRVPRA